MELLLRSGISVTATRPTCANPSAYAAGPPWRTQRDELRGRLYCGIGKFKDTTGRGFRSLSKAFDKERYAKVEVMGSSLVSEAG
jgi:hypothetical protein